ncbi:MAG: peptidase [Gemmatimonadetes bacterium]|nr:peptidase [Gemmatimonadota bacterium]
MQRTVHRILMACVAALAGCVPAARTGEPAPARASTPSGASAQAQASRAARAVPVARAYAAALAKGTRASDGSPGARYWQQRVRYRIEAALDPATATVSGTERIVYFNRSPDTLRTAVFNLYQNIFTPGVIRNRFVPEFEGGVTLERMAVGGQALLAKSAGPSGFPAVPGFAVRGTLGHVTLPAAIAPGDSAVFEVAWHHTVPPRGAFRTGWEDALGARAFVVAQWYPQIAVYDDLRGWDDTPYLGDGEFYLEYGDFDVALTLPAGWIVGATGELANAAEALSPATRARLDRALAADTGTVVSEADFASKAATAAGVDGRVTWRFHAAQVRDFAFAASDHYRWEVAHAEVAGEGGAMRRVAVHSMYRPGAPGWDQARSYGAHAVGFLSRRLAPYPYPQVTVAEGPISGMEYPMLVFIARPAKAEDLQSVIAHEVGHEWFPMMVGSDEASYAWMDEGINTYDEELAVRDFYPRSEPWLGDLGSYLRVAGGDAEVPLMRHTDLVSPYGARTVAAYSKPAVVLRALRGVVGDSVLARAMRTYVREWTWRHPRPWDFFHTVERVAGRDLSWFWEPWFFGTGTMDQAVTAVEPVSGGVRVTVRDLGEIAMPTTVTVWSGDGGKTAVEIPVETWLRGAREVTVSVPAFGSVTRVRIDADELFPDVNRANDEWTPAGR